MKKSSGPFGQRFLVAYSGVLTAVLAIALLAGFGGARSTPTQITVERINIVEPDGTLRMVITNSARSPGLYIRGTERLAGTRTSAGMLFMNDEGTETGGLIFGGRTDANGTVRNYGHLSFDQYMQDQVLSLDGRQTNEQRRSLLTVTDRPNWSIEEYIALIERIQSLPPEQQEAEINEFRATHPDAQHRATFGRSEDRSAAMRLKDEQGRDRVIISAPASGDPVLQFLDANGQVIRQLP